MSSSITASTPPSTATRYLGARDPSNHPALALLRRAGEQARQLRERKAPFQAEADDVSPGCPEPEPRPEPSDWRVRVLLIRVRRLALADPSNRQQVEHLVGRIQEMAAAFGVDALAVIAGELQQLEDRPVPEATPDRRALLERMAQCREAKRQRHEAENAWTEADQEPLACRRSRSRRLRMARRRD